MDEKHKTTPESASPTVLNYSRPKTAGGHEKHARARLLISIVMLVGGSFLMLPLVMTLTAPPVAWLCTGPFAVMGFFYAVAGISGLRKLQKSAEA